MANYVRDTNSHIVEKNSETFLIHVHKRNLPSICFFYTVRIVRPIRLHHRPDVWRRLQNIVDQSDARDDCRRFPADDAQDLSVSSDARRRTGNGELQEQDG